MEKRALAVAGPAPFVASAVDAEGDLAVAAGVVLLAVGHIARGRQPHCVGAPRPGADRNIVGASTSARAHTRGQCGCYPAGAAGATGDRDGPTPQQLVI